MPDEALATVFEIDSAEVARRRARAIEHLADEMDLQRGEDLGAVLKALLEAETWNAAAATLGEEFAAGAGGGGARLSAVPLPAEPEPEPEPVSGPTLAPVPPVEEPDGVDAGPPSRARSSRPANQCSRCSRTAIVRIPIHRGGEPCSPS